MSTRQEIEQGIYDLMTDLLFIYTQGIYCPYTSILLVSTTLLSRVHGQPASCSRGNGIFWRATSTVAERLGDTGVLDTFPIMEQGDGYVVG